MKIRKVDDKPMIIHTKEKAKIHAHEPKGAKIKGSNIYTVERGPKTIGAKVSDDKKKPIIVESEPDWYVKQVMEDFVVRAERIRGGGVDPSVDNLCSYYQGDMQDGRGGIDFKCLCTSENIRRKRLYSKEDGCFQSNNGSIFTISTFRSF